MHGLHPTSNDGRCNRDALNNLKDQVYNKRRVSHPQYRRRACTCIGVALDLELL